MRKFINREKKTMRRKVFSIAIRITCITLVLGVLAGLVYAASTSILSPTSDGSYTQWSPSSGSTHYTMVNETPCSSGDYDYVLGSWQSTNIRDSYHLTITSIPNGSTITRVDVTVCYADNVHYGLVGEFQTFARINDTDTDSGSTIYVADGMPKSSTTQQIDVPDTVKDSLTTLEIGVLKINDPSIRVYAIDAVVQYDPPGPPGNITIIKETDPDGDTTTFDFTASYNVGGFQLSDGQSNASGPLSAGNYDVTESVPTGWDLDSVVCTGGDSTPISNGVTIHLGPEDDITCTFTNKEEPPSICRPTIDFDADAYGAPLVVGEEIAEQWAAWGVHVTYSVNDPRDGPVIVFDSANPTCGDADLGTPNEAYGGPGQGYGPGAGTDNTQPLGKIMVLGENTTCQPNDSGDGGTITFSFDQPMRVDDVHIMDIDSDESAGTVVAYDAGDTEIISSNMQVLGDNSFQIVPVNASGVRKLEINFPSSGGVPAIVFCRGELGSIGDYVWHDLNGDGIQDAGETGLDGVTVNLYDGSDNLKDTTATSGGGFYSFTNLTPGDYYVEFVAPSGYVFTLQDQGSDDAVDSDADTTTGKTAVTTLVSGETDLTWDAGLYQPASIGDYVWHDLNGDGIQDAGESGLDGVTVNLYDGSDNLKDTTATSGGGFYSFTNLTPGDYYVEFVAPSGYVFTLQNQGSDDTVDSDADTATGKTAVTTLVSGETDLTWDAGLHQLDSICLPTIDFDTDAGGNSLAIGQIIDDEWAAWGVHVSTNDPNHPVMIFDSSNPTGNDPDLGTPNETFVGPGIGLGGESGQPGENSISQGKILIISTDGNQSNPNDHAGGGTITFTFDDPTRVKEVHVLDIEETGSKIRAWNAETGGTLLAEVNMQTYGDNSFQVVPVNASGVRRLEIIFGGSGGVPAILFCPGSIGDYVWNDAAPSPFGTIGIQDDGEKGINGVELELWLDNDGDLNVSTGDTLLSTTTTITNTTTGKGGWYLFDGLSAGDYIVRIAPAEFDSGGTLYEYTATQPNKAGVDDALDSDGDNPDCPYPCGSGDIVWEDNILATTTLTQDAQGNVSYDLTIDFGVVYTGPPTAVTLSSFAARPSTGGSTNWLWLGLAGLTVLAAGGSLWIRRQSRQGKIV